MRHADLIIGFREAHSNPIKRNRMFQKVLDQYFELITDILIRKGVPNVNIKDSIEYAVALTALYEALETKFNIDSGYEFSTYLTHHIGLHLTRHFAGYVCGVSRFASSYDTLETLDRKVYQSDCSNDQSFDTYEDSGFSQEDPEEFSEYPCLETLSDESEELLVSKPPLSDVPLYEQMDNEEDMDNTLLSQFSSAVTLGIKLLTGLAGYGKSGKIHVFRLIGTEYRDELTQVLDHYNLVS
jgi:hypothetical protein